jgi:TIR domain
VWPTFSSVKRPRLGLLDLSNELEAQGHTPQIHEWEVKSGDDIYAWMEVRHDAADHVLCIVSSAERVIGRMRELDFAVRLHAVVVELPQRELQERQAIGSLGVGKVREAKDRRN